MRERLHFTWRVWPSPVYSKDWPTGVRDVFVGTMLQSLGFEPGGAVFGSGLIGMPSQASAFDICSASVLSPKTLTTAATLNPRHRASTTH